MVKKKLFYRSHCWGGEERIIQLIVGSNGTFECPHCHVKGIYNEEKRKQIAKRQAEAIVNRTIKSLRSSYLETY